MRITKSEHDEHIASGRCREFVHGGRIGLLKCMNRAKRDGLCGVHHPDNIARIRALAEKKYVEKVERLDRQQARANYAFDAARACRDAGIVDPAKELPEILRKWSELKNRSRK